MSAYNTNTYLQGANVSQVPTKARNLFLALFVAFQISFLILFRTLTTYPDSNVANSSVASINTMTYIHYSNIAVMVLVGYSFLYTFNRLGSLSSLFSAFALTAVVFQWGLLVFEFWERVDSGEWSTPYNLDIPSLIHTLYATTAVLVSFGSVLGKASVVQLVFIAVFEVVLYHLNRYIIQYQLNINDFELAVFVHVFGAAFGLGLLLFIGHKIDNTTESRKVSNISSNLTSLLGSFFLFAFFPSYNVFLAPSGSEARVIVNTFISITSAVVTTFAFSSFMNGGKWQPEEIRNAAISGGVAMASSISVLCGPAAASGAGLVAAITVQLGIRYFDPFLARLGFRDSTHIQSVHGLSGLVAAVGSMIAIADAESQGTFYGIDFTTVYPSGENAAGNLVAGYFITVGIALACGVVTGFLFSFSFFLPKNTASAFLDDDWVILSGSLTSKVATSAPVAAAPVATISRQAFASYNTQQVADWLSSINLSASATLVQQDGIVGEDILNTTQGRLVSYFGDDAAKSIMQAVSSFSA